MKVTAPTTFLGVTCTRTTATQRRRGIGRGKRTQDTQGSGPRANLTTATYVSVFQEESSSVQSVTGVRALGPARVLSIGSGTYRSAIHDRLHADFSFRERLYRCDLLPPSCPRCHESFANEKSKLEHLVAPVPCTVRNQPPVDGIDPARYELLRSRKFLQGHDTEAEKWCAVYPALFPEIEEQCIPGPCKS